MKKFLIMLALTMISLMLYAEETQQKERFYFFYSDSCPHCHEAMPLIESLEKEFPNIDFQKLEVSQSPENSEIFNKKMEKLSTHASGVPTFVFRDKYVVGFIKGTYEEKIRAMITASAEKPAAALPDKTDKSKQAKTPAQPEKTPKKTAPVPAK